MHEDETPSPDLTRRLLVGIATSGSAENQIHCLLGLVTCSPKSAHH